MSVNLHNNEINIKRTKGCQPEWIFHCEEDLIDAIDEILMEWHVAQMDGVWP